MDIEKIAKSIRPCPLCDNPVHIQIRYDRTFPVQCRHCQKEWVLPTEMDFCQNNPLKVKARSIHQAVKDWNKLAKVESWRSKYWDSGDGSLMRDIDRDEDGTSIEEIGRYEVVFDFEGVRYYCYLDAIDIDEAMGVFRKTHPGITIEHIVDTLEV